MNMSLERAIEINDLCVNHFLHGMGLRPVPQAGFEALSLRELAEAAEIMRAQPSAGSLRLVCDDRFVAALYVAHHYHGEDPEAGRMETCAYAQGKGVVVVKMPGPEEEEEEEAL